MEGGVNTLTKNLIAGTKSIVYQLVRIIEAMLRLPLLLSFFLFLPSSGLTDSAVAYFAGGCFWCMESAYQEHTGVTDVVSGFTGGVLENPTYKGRHEGHYETVKVTYNPAKVSYQELLAFYWVNVDPFDGSGQFCDKGFSYQSAIFVADDKQRVLAEASLAAINKQFPDATVHTKVLDVTQFWPVGEEHQDYYLKNPMRYKFYRWNCGRDRRLKEIWRDRIR